MKALKLTIKTCWFELIASGAKRIEYRRPSAWIESRLYHKNGKRREYDVVLFRAGYGKDARTLSMHYGGFEVVRKAEVVRYRNGMTVEVSAGDYGIILNTIFKPKIEKK
jgi:hypothetical protein